MQVYIDNGVVKNYCEKPLNIFNDEEFVRKYIGHVFQINDIHYMLAIVEYRSYMLVNLQSGNRLNSPGNCIEITQSLVESKAVHLGRMIPRSGTFEK